MSKNILPLCLLLLLLSACSLPLGKERGLFGRFPENYEDPEDGFTLWMPANMRSQFGINHANVQKRIDACVSGRPNFVRNASASATSSFIAVENACRTPASIGGVKSSECVMSL